MTVGQLMSGMRTRQMPWLSALRVLTATATAATATATAATAATVTATTAAVTVSFPSEGMSVALDAVESTNYKSYQSLS